LVLTVFNDSLVEEEKSFLIDESLKFRIGQFEEFTTFAWRDLSGVSCNLLSKFLNVFTNYKLKLKK